MSRVPLAARDARALRIGAIVLIPALAYVGVVAPFARSIMEDRRTLSASERELASDRALVARTNNFAAQRSATTTWLAKEARRLFRGHDDIAATSDLGDYVTAAAAQSGVQLRHTETRASTPVSGALRAVRLDIRAEGSPRATLNFIRALERGDRLVRIGRLVMDRAATGAAAQDTTGAAKRAPGAARLSIVAELYGYTLIPMPSSVRVVASEMGAAYVPLPGSNANNSSAALANSVIQNPFSLDRGQPVAAASVSREPPPFPIQLLGTVVGQAATTFAMCQVEGVGTTAVHTGDRVAGYTLRDIQRGSIVLIDDAGRTVHLTLPTPGS